MNYDGIVTVLLTFAITTLIVVGAQLSVNKDKVRGLCNRDGLMFVESSDRGQGEYYCVEKIPIVE